MTAQEVVKLCQAAHAHALRGNLEEAARQYEHALARDPRCRPALFNRGSLLLQLHRPRDALDCFERLVALGPAAAAVYLARANALTALGMSGAALASIEEAIRLDPADTRALCNHGHVLLAIGRPQDALASLDRAFALAPRDPLVLYNRGNVLLALQRRTDALESFDRAVQSDPRFTFAWYNRGSTLTVLHRHAEAIASFDRALTLDPGMEAAHNNRGAALLALRRFNEAAEAFARVLQIRPDHCGALENLGNTYSGLRRFDEAARAYSRLLSIAPEHPYAAGNVLDAMVRSCDWGADYVALRGRVARSVDRQMPAQTPFQFLLTSDSPAAQLRCARTFAADKYAAVGEPAWRGPVYAHSRIRVAYVSADFHEHATAILAAELFERHDRSMFEWTAVSFGPDDGSPMRRRLERAFDRFVDVRGISDEEVARLIRQGEIDIAVDMKGYTADCRTGIFARRPAPVQANYLGYPGTTGVPYMDYIIADQVVIPPGYLPFYSENVVHLPGCYQPNGSGRAVAAITPSRAQVSLPEQAFVFCCFNGSGKITPEVFAIWMRLLNAIPDGVLWLFEDNDTATRNLRQEAGRRGVEPSRLLFAPRLPPSEHVARYCLADLFLDTLPCNAHTTASDALWAGVPVLTAQGETFAGRVAASLLHAAGLSELITRDLQEYEGLALALASDRARLAALRARLTAQRESCPLFDTERYRRSLESAYILMWQRAERRLPPTYLDLVRPRTPSAEAIACRSV